MEQQILDIINVVLKNRGKSLISFLDDHHDLRNDLGFDSLDLAELSVRIEAELNRDVFEDGIVTSVRELLDKLIE